MCRAQLLFATAVALSVLLLLMHADGRCVCGAVIVAWLYYSARSADRATGARATGGGGMTVWHNPPRYAPDYSRYAWQVKKMSKTLGVVGLSPDALSAMYALYKHGTTKNTWGSVGDEFKLSHKFSDRILGRLPHGGTYVDYGCGNGAIAKSIGDRYGYDAHCVDTEDFRDEGAKGMKFIRSENVDSIDALDDNSVALVSAIQSLHHINFDARLTKRGFEESVVGVVKKVRAKLAPGGAFLLREHDVTSVRDLCPVIFEHLLYEIAEMEDKTMTRGELENYIKKYHETHRGWYFGKGDLHALLTANGFSLVETELKPGKNVSRIYNSLYVV